MSTALSVRALAKRYGELQALDGVSFDLDGGELLAVVGPERGRQDDPAVDHRRQHRAERGRVRVRRRAASAGRPSARLCTRGCRCAENLELFARLEGVADPARRSTERMLEQTALAPRADDLLIHLSGGNRQRVNVALALIAEPAVLALDEPTAALDPGQRERLWEFIRGLVDGGTAVLYSTHNVSEAQPPRTPRAGPGRGRALLRRQPRRADARPAASRRTATSSTRWCASYRRLAGAGVRRAGSERRAGRGGRPEP